MSQDFKQLLKPEVINKVSGLSLIARIIVDRYLSGLNKSRRVGVGMEFSQYRGYEPGDDLRMLDWKMLARSGRYYIKQADIETNISIKFVLDSSKSMLYEENKLSKMDFSRVLIASLAHLARSQGDSIALYALNDNKLYSVASSAQKQHFNRILLELINIKNEGKWPNNSLTTQKMHSRNKKELILFFTDMYEYNEELTKSIKQLKTLHNEVIIMHMLGNNELKFEYEGAFTFEDLETGERVKLNAKEAKEKYLNKLDTRIKSIKNDMLEAGISYQLFNLDDNIGESLQLFLKKRNRLL